MHTDVEYQEQDKQAHRPHASPPTDAGRGAGPQAGGVGG